MVTTIYKPAFGEISMLIISIMKRVCYTKNTFDFNLFCIVLFQQS